MVVMRFVLGGCGCCLLQLGCWCGVVLIGCLDWFAGRACWFCVLGVGLLLFISL